MSLTTSLLARTTPVALDRNLVEVDPDFAALLQTEHSRTFEDVATETSVGPEAFTRVLPGVSDDVLEDLDERGLVRPGARIIPGSYLVGKVRPRAGKPIRPEDRLLRAMFGTKAGDVLDVSLRAPADCVGTVLEAELHEVEGQAQARVVVGWSRPLEVGDVLELDGEPVLVAAIRPLGAELGWSGGRSPVLVSKVVMARDTLHARSIGAYAGLTQLPVTDPERFEPEVMERAAVDALGAHAPWTLWELLTLKADGVGGRMRAYELLLKGENPAEVLRPPTSRSKLDEIFSFPDEPRPPASGDVLCLLPHAIRRVAAGLQALGIEVRFEAEEIGATLFDSDALRDRSHGAVTGSGIADPQTRRPVNGGIHCERIFGPIEDFRCACGKHVGVEPRGRVCEQCGVEVTHSRARQERFGHIELARPCLNPLFIEDSASLPDAFRRWRAVPVLPPWLRPPGLDAHYQRLIEANQQGADVQEEVNELCHALMAMIEEIWREQVFTKPADYSGTAHLVVEPGLDPQHCRVPRAMLKELFQPFASGILITRGHTIAIRAARRMLEADMPEALQAVEEASEGYPLLLSWESRIVVRRVRAWDAPAIAVDPATAQMLCSPLVRVDVPLSHEAAIECSKLPDLPQPADRSAQGWLSRASRDLALLPAVRRAALRGERERIEDPVLACALGRPPERLDPGEMERWRAAEEERRAAASPAGD